jgi:hypothetical protein
MHQCPHCGQPGISYLRKWWSRAAAPAQCNRCEKLSYVPDTVSNGIFSVGILLLVLTVVFATGTKSLIVAALGFAGSVGCYCFLWHVVKLRLTSPERAAEARKLSWGMLIIAAAAALLS